MNGSNSSAPRCTVVTKDVNFLGWCYPARDLMRPFPSDLTTMWPVSTGLKNDILNSLRSWTSHRPRELCERYRRYRRYRLPNNNPYRAKER